MLATLIAFPTPTPDAPRPALELVKPCTLCEQTARFRITRLTTLHAMLDEVHVLSCSDHLAKLVDASLADPFAVTEPTVCGYQR